MRLASIGPALLVFFPVLIFARALPDTSTSTTDYSLYCALSGPSPYNGYGCSWTSGDDGALKCSCNVPTYGQVDLAHFFSAPNYGGFEYIGYGSYGECYNLEYSWWKQKVGSLTTGNLCKVYLQPNCADPAVTESGNVPSFPYSSGNGIASFICIEPGPSYPPPSPYYSASIPIPTSLLSSVYVSPTKSSSSATSKSGGQLTSPTPSTSAYAPPPPKSSSTSKSGGVYVTPPPILPSSVYVPPKSPVYSPPTSKSGGVVITPTPSSSVYVSPPPSKSTSKSGGDVSTPSPTPVYSPPPKASSSSTSKSGGHHTTPTPHSTPVYYQPPPPATSPYDDYNPYTDYNDYNDYDDYP